MFTAETCVLPAENAGRCWGLEGVDRPCGALGGVAADFDPNRTCFLWSPRTLRATSENGATFFQIFPDPN